MSIKRPDFDWGSFLIPFVVILTVFFVYRFTIFGFNRIESILMSSFLTLIIVFIMLKGGSLE